ncbi:MAG: sulfite exporter TauE/SafE family protein, partial [Thermoplasmata archaeon]
VGSSLLVDVITTSAVIYVYLKNKNVAVKNSITMGLGALVGAQIGTRIAVTVSERPLEIAFVVLTVILAVQMFRRTKNPTPKMRKVNIGIGKWAMPAAFALSIPVGILTGTLGTSGGIMFIGITMILFSINAQKMVGTATLAMMLSAISGVAGYSYFGRIDYIDAIIIGIISLASGYGFSIMANSISEKKIYFSIGLVFTGVVITEIVKIMGII